MPQQQKLSSFLPPARQDLHKLMCPCTAAITSISLLGDTWFVPGIHTTTVEWLGEVLSPLFSIDNVKYSCFSPRQILLLTKSTVALCCCKKSRPRRASVDRGLTTRVCNLNWTPKELHVCLPVLCPHTSSGDPLTLTSCCPVQGFSRVACDWICFPVLSCSRVMPT